jgi:hypothetical protein
VSEASELGQSAPLAKKRAKREEANELRRSAQLETSPSEPSNHE